MDYNNLICKTVQGIPFSGIRRFFDPLDSETISLGVGEPDFPTPEDVRRQAIETLRTGPIKYTSNSGSYELRELIIQYLSARFGINNNYTPENVLITVGASEAIDLAMRAIIDPGDEVIVPEPTYIAYTPGIKFAYGIPVFIKVNVKTGFKITPDALRAAITPRTKAILLPYPNNPTGGIMEREDLEAIADVIRDTDILVVTDEIYAELTYNGKRHVSFASIPGMAERTIVLNGFSKAFCMTGWRLGYAVGPRELIAAMTKVHQYSMLCAPTPAQYAGEATIRIGFENQFANVKKVYDEYDRRRRFIVDSFNRLGLTCHEPEGAFYIFPSIKSTGMTSENFCDALLKKANVAIVPGTAFGGSGEGFVRGCYATSMENLEKAVERIERFLRTL